MLFSWQHSPSRREMAAYKVEPVTEPLDLEAVHVRLGAAYAWSSSGRLRRASTIAVRQGKRLQEAIARSRQFIGRLPTCDW